MVGIEPTTYGLRNRCSTTELHWLNRHVPSGNYYALRKRGGKQFRRGIESGVDIPTIRRGLGHKDGGALAMKVYGHLREEHSFAMIKIVSFISSGLPNRASL